MNSPSWPGGSLSFQSDGTATLAPVGKFSPLGNMVSEVVVPGAVWMTSKNFTNVSIGLKEPLPFPHLIPGPMILAMGKAALFTGHWFKAETRTCSTSLCRHVLLVGSIAESSIDNSNSLYQGLANHGP